MAHQKIPATVITGFLGAGKTTLIRNLLLSANGRRIALIINEFGDLGVDGDVLKGCGEETCTQDDIVELTNGCICCTVADDFIPTIEALLARENRPDHIVIETSGLALPQPLVNAFNWPQIRENVTVDGVITVVDAPAVGEGRFANDEARVAQQRTDDDSLDHDSPLEELFGDQLTCADMIVINKCDLVEPDKLSQIEARIRSQSQQGVTLVRASNGSLGADVLLGIGAASENDIQNRKSRHETQHDAHHADDHGDHDDDHHHHHHDHDHDEFVSFVVNASEISEPASFIKQLKSVIGEHDILRLKGFINVKDKPMRMVVQGVGTRIDQYFDREWEANEARETRLVVIGLAGLDQSKITDAITGAAR